MRIAAMLFNWCMKNFRRRKIQHSGRGITAWIWDTPYGEIIISRVGRNWYLDDGWNIHQIRVAPGFAQVLLRWWQEDNDNCYY